MNQSQREDRDYLSRRQVTQEPPEEPAQANTAIALLALGVIVGTIYITDRFIVGEHSRWLTR